MLGYYGEYDAVVCGGGTSGVSAAIAVARAGTKTLIIECVGQLGGQMNYSGPPGFSLAWLCNAGHEQIVGGISEEIYNMMLEDGYVMAEHRQKQRAVYQFDHIDPDWFGIHIYQLLTKAGCELMLHSLVTEVVREGDEVKGIICEHPGGRPMVPGEVVIDCMGEGEVCYVADAQIDILPKDLLEPATAAFTRDGVDWDRFTEYFMNRLEEFDLNHIYDPYVSMNEDEIRNEIRKDVKTIEDVGKIMGFVCLHGKAMEVGEWHSHSGVGFFIISREGGRIQAHLQHSSQARRVDCTDAKDLIRAETEAREQNEIAYKFFRKYVPSFESMYITRVYPEARTRETRRVAGDYILTVEDAAEVRKFEDVTGKNSFPTGPKHVLPTDENITNGTLTVASVVRHSKNGGSSDISYRTLVVRGLENILVAGEAISTDRPSHNRFLQQTMVTGQAAGYAIAIYAGEGITPRQLEGSINELRGLPSKQGVILYGTHQTCLSSKTVLRQMTKLVAKYTTIN